jgi:pimeloyl-ACP methyl ester carboxylesterase
MSGPSPQFLEVGAGATRRRIAVIAEPAGALTFVWLPGFKSDMVSTKATALAEWCRLKGHGVLRFDYSGHGQSEGRFEEGTVGRWLEEAGAVVREFAAGPMILVGSSMGGYIALLLLRRLMAQDPAAARRIKALALIAPAWDFTEELIWSAMGERARAELMASGVWMRPSEYGEPYPITRALIEEGRAHLLGREPWDPGRPIHILHGLLDPDVPWEHSLELDSFLLGGHVRITAVPDGEHRLSRPEDLERLTTLLDQLAGA